MVRKRWFSPPSHTKLAKRQLYNKKLLDSPQHAVPRLGDNARGGLGGLRRDPLHARQGTRRRVGGNPDSAAAQRPFRLPLGHHPQRPAVRRVGGPPAPPALPRGVHGLQAHAPPALHLSRRRQRDTHGGGRDGEFLIARGGEFARELAGFW